MTGAKSLLNQALGESSKGTYKRAWEVYKAFRCKYDVKPVFPIAKDTMFLFVVYMQQEGYASTTISSYASALGYAHKLADIPDPSSSFLVRKSLQTVRKIKPAFDKRLPITKHILETLFMSTELAFKDMYIKNLYQSMFLLSFHAFLRVGEITTSPHILHLADVATTAEQITIRFRSAKHSAGNSQQVSVQAMQNSRFCPVKSVLTYLKGRGTLPGPLFLLNGRSVARQEFVKTLKNLLTMAGIPADRFNSHSFRIGAATTCAENGASDAQIRELGRWQSDAFKKYIRMPNVLQNPL